MTVKEMSETEPTSDEPIGAFLCVCVTVMIIAVFLIPSLFTLTPYPAYSGYIAPVTVVVFLCAAFWCVIGFGMLDERTKKGRVVVDKTTGTVVQTAQRTAKVRTRRTPGSDLALAKTRRGQLFWHGRGARTQETRTSTEDVSALRGGEIIGGRFRFKVKVLNESPYTINDITVYILSYPRDTLLLRTEDDDIFFSKIEPQGFRSPTFDFLPTQDCVRGEIVAGVSYVDAFGKAHTLTTESFTIRAVCDLLQPDAISPEQFEAKLKDLESGEIILKVEEWTPEEMQDKTLRVLSDSNFHEVSSEETETEGVLHYKISGWARGKYTGKNVGAEVFITGKKGKTGASCRIRVTGEDDAMILPTIDDLKERLSAYLCPMCGSKLTLENVEDLKKGKIVCCPFCNVSIGR